MNKKTVSFSLIPFILLVSGIAGLIYEQVWIRWLSLLFGMTAPAVAVTLAAYFFGLAIGARFGPGILQGNPLKAFVIWEIVAASGSLFVVGSLKCYNVLYPFFYSLLSEHASIFLLFKFLLSFIILLPTTFSLGATLPVLTKILPKGKEGARKLNFWCCGGRSVCRIRFSPLDWCFGNIRYWYRAQPTCSGGSILNIIQNDIFILHTG